MRSGSRDRSRRVGAAALFGAASYSHLVLEVDGAFLRVQCKTGRLRGGCVIFHAQSIRSNMRETSIRDYKEDATRTQGTLRISPTANGQDKGVRWARDYELPA